MRAYVDAIRNHLELRDKDRCVLLSEPNAQRTARTMSNLTGLEGTR
jgi:hypothetical protein